MVDKCAEVKVGVLFCKTVSVNFFIFHFCVVVRESWSREINNILIRAQTLLGVETNFLHILPRFGIFPKLTSTVSLYVLLSDK